MYPSRMSLRCRCTRAVRSRSVERGADESGRMSSRGVDEVANSGGTAPHAGPKLPRGPSFELGLAPPCVEGRALKSFESEAGAFMPDGGRAWWMGLPVNPEVIGIRTPGVFGLPGGTTRLALICCAEAGRGFAATSGFLSDCLCC